MKPGSSSRAVSGRRSIGLLLPAHVAVRAFTDGRGTIVGVWNWFRPVAGCFLRALYQPRKQSSRVFAVLFGQLPLCVIAHEQQHTTGAFVACAKNFSRRCKES